MVECRDARYKSRNDYGEEVIVHFETNANVVIETDEKQFVSKEEKEMLAEVSKATKQHIHTQIASSDEWFIEHNLGKMPKVTIMDSAGTVVYGEIHYINDNIIIIRFTDAFSGIAVIN